MAIPTRSKPKKTKASKPNSDKDIHDKDNLHKSNNTTTHETKPQSTPTFTSPLTNSFQKTKNSSKTTTIAKKAKFQHSNKQNEIQIEREQKRAKKLQDEEKEEQRLTSLIFGHGDDEYNAGVESHISAWHDEDDDDEVSEDDNDNEVNGDDSLFVLDHEKVDQESITHGGEDSKYQYHNEENSNDDNDNDDDDDSTTSEKNQAKKSAWLDEDDEQLAISLTKGSDRIKKLRNSLNEDIIGGHEYEQRLRQRFQSTVMTTVPTDWARIDENDQREQHTSTSSDNDDDEYDDSENHISTVTELLSSTTSLLSSTKSKLSPNVIQMVRKPDANQSHYNESTVQAVQFHPDSDIDQPLLFTAGLDKTLRFFKVGMNGEGTEKVHGVHFPHLPIHSASFLGDSGSVIVSGRRSFFYVYDTIEGKIDKIPKIHGREEKSLEKFATSPDGSFIAFIGNDGYIILVDGKTKSWIGDYKMNGSARAVSFTPCSGFIVASGSDGDVYRWDIRSKKCVDRFHNEDGTITSTLSLSCKNILAVGAESGVVNLYNDQGLYSRPFTKRQPIKSVMNLPTSVDYLKFNHDGQILAMSTRREKDGLKLLHVPSQTVFSNWPTSKTPLGYVWSLDFSPGSRYVAIGNDKGKCMLYKLGHYSE